MNTYTGTFLAGVWIMMGKPVQKRTIEYKAGIMINPNETWRFASI